MTGPWWEGPLLAVDTETTGVDPETARIVTAACIGVGADGVAFRKTWLADPGVEIPDGATAIHGITTEKARADGAPAAEVVAAVAAIIQQAWGRTTPIPAVFMNACYDLTVISRELARHGLPQFETGPVLDPLVIDHGLDRYRKGSRKLVDLAQHYGVRLEGAHSSDGDALAAARVVWMQARHPKRGRILQLMTLAEMQRWQATAHAEWAAHLQEYRRTKAQPRDPNAVVDGSWPWKPLPAVEGASA